MSIFLADEQSHSVDIDDLHALAEMVLTEEGYPKEAEVTLLLVDESEMASYNQRFLERQGPTDVLAFPVEALLPGVAPEWNPSSPPLLLGDVVISPEYVQKQAADLETTFEDEMALMVTHGLLHLLGYDHEEERDAVKMESRESELLAKVGRKRR